jgi:hypothetical protein
MSTTISPQVRLIALIGVIVAVAGGLAFMAMSHAHGSSTTAPKVIKPLHPVNKHAVTPAHTVKPVTPHATRPVEPAPKPVVKHRAPRLVASNGLPIAIAQSLRKHPVVVVALYQPRRDASRAQLQAAFTGTSPVAAIDFDRFALAEAAAGAKDANAGFVGINVLSQRQAKPLATVFGMLEDPTVLVFTCPRLASGKLTKCPGQLSVELLGYSDRTMVAQAATNANG